MSKWDDFPRLPEPVQARILLEVASAAWKQQSAFGDIKAEVQEYLKLGYELLEGRCEKLPQLIKFLDDPEMAHDFGAFYERLKDNKSAAAALDIASYACGFVSRMVAKKCQYGPLPDPVLEALPDIYEYYQEQAALLGV